MTLGPLSSQPDGALDVRVVSADATTAGEDAVLVNSNGTVVVTIATADRMDGNTLVVTDAAGSASIGHPIIIQTEGSALVDGESRICILKSRGSVELYSDGSNWFVSAVRGDLGVEVIDRFTTDTSAEYVKYGPGTVSQDTTAGTVTVTSSDATTIYATQDEYGAGVYTADLVASSGPTVGLAIGVGGPNSGYACFIRPGDNTGNEIQVQNIGGASVTAPASITSGETYTFTIVWTPESGQLAAYLDDEGLTGDPIVTLQDANIQQGGVGIHAYNTDSECSRLVIDAKRAI